jgi:protein-S-isoprenylcysteine O-methyltransferase Ste14
MPMNSFLSVEQVSPLNLILIIAGASLCLASYLFRLLTHIYSYTKDAEIFNFRFLLIVTFLGYFGWGYWSSTDPVKMNIPSAVSIPAGVSLAVTGMGLFLYSEFRKHGVGDADSLVTTGIYSKIRHPMYIGLVLLHLGYPLIFKSFTGCLSTVLWALIIAVWTHFEEKNLERSFGQRYIQYKRQTWF